eukprot:1176729-Prorocentrum_minimum.AAC.7
MNQAGTHLHKRARKARSQQDQRVRALTSTGAGARFPAVADSLAVSRRSAWAISAGPFTARPPSPPPLEAPRLVAADSDSSPRIAWEMGKSEEKGNSRETGKSGIRLWDEWVRVASGKGIRTSEVERA